ncbi:restriction endonuclease subunit S [Vibrio natriegens]|uniref:restriction endonuclease subunit S n=1 Tax=Vibrio natriegens TaxID=691 RepID=UPI001FB9FD6F|nr:restriction endonuclease subunit S [Vibrio natriegens]
MSSNYIALEQFVNFINGDRGKNYPSNNDYVDSGVAFISAADINNGKVNWKSAKKITEDKCASLRSGQVKQGDLLFCLRGSIGKIARITEPYKGAIASSLVILRPKENVDIDFIYYFLNSPDGQAKAVGLDNGSVQPNVSVKSMSKIDIPRISLKEQQVFVRVLNSIDNKIDNNYQTNQTLEGVAHALFKSWFVDFDPVKAKMNGEPLEGMDTATGSLFPEKLVESELGLIPEGWGIGELSKLFELHRGFDLPKSKRQDGEYPVYAAGGYHGTHNEYKMEPPGIITGRSGVIGNVYLSLDKYWPLNTTLYVREFRTCGPYYAYHLLRSLDLKSLNSGSAVPSLNRNFVHSTNVCHPDSGVLAKFEEIVTPLFEKMVANNEQNKTLSELRDTLLPKLLSGEITLG